MSNGGSRAERENEKRPGTEKIACECVCVTL